MLESLKDQGIILRSVDSGEADKQLSILTEYHGLINVVAKGVRRAKSRRSGHIDVANLVKIQLSRSATITILDDISTISDFQNVKKNFEYLKKVYLFFEIIYYLIPKEVEDNTLFLSLVNYLRLLEENKNDKKTDQQFGEYLLRHSGFPEPNIRFKDNLFGYFEQILSRKITAFEMNN